MRWLYRYEMSFGNEIILRWDVGSLKGDLKKKIHWQGKLSLYLSVGERYELYLITPQIGTVLIGPNYNCVCATMYVVAIYS